MSPWRTGLLPVVITVKGFSIFFVVTSLCKSNDFPVFEAISSFTNFPPLLVCKRGKDSCAMSQFPLITEFFYDVYFSLISDGIFEHET